MLSNLHYNSNHLFGIPLKFIFILQIMVKVVCLFYENNKAWRQLTSVTLIAIFLILTANIVN